MAGNGNRHTHQVRAAFIPAAESRHRTDTSFSWFIVSLLGSEEAGNSGKVDPAESQARIVAQRKRRSQVTKYIIQGELGGAVVEHFECEQARR